LALHVGVDAAFPGAPLPPGTEVLAAYVGKPGAGAPDTPHVWTAADWNTYVFKHKTLRLLPIYVHNYADGNPEADAANAVAAVKALGWSPHKPGTETRIIIVDCETFVDPAYFSAVQAGIVKGGYKPVLYGSAAFVTKNPCANGYWIADYNYSHAPTALPSNWLGLQWKSGSPWDSNVFSDELMAGTGVGLRHG
jgi:hypothetical protein